MYFKHGQGVDQKILAGACSTYHVPCTTPSFFAITNLNLGPVSFQVTPYGINYYLRYITENPGGKENTPYLG